jgi:glutaconate CoA-transferase subunit A
MVSDHVQPHCSLALGGLHFHNTPMAGVREIIRQEIPLDRLIPPIDGSINADQLIGAGLVKEIHAPYVGLEHLGMAPRFRAAVEYGDLKVRETEEAGFVLGFQAAAAGLPFVVLPAGFFPRDVDRPTVPGVNPTDYREIVDPFTGRTHHAARAIRPDVGIVHCQAVDRRGNGAFLGGTFLDIEVAKASAVCIVVAERVVDELPSDSAGYLPSFVIDAYAIVEGGAHPGSSHGLYRHDEDHLRRYIKAAATAEGFAAYRAEVIGESESHYQGAAGVPERCRELRTK